MALHEQAVGKTNEWYTPRYVFEAMNVVFDLDVAPARSPAPAEGFCREDLLDGLRDEWRGFVWMNPPFGGRNGLVPWIERFFRHGNGVCLVPDRTSAPWWQDAARNVDAILFVASKIKFLDAFGVPGTSPAQGTCLMARGVQGINALLTAQTNDLGITLRRF